MKYTNKTMALLILISINVVASPVGTIFNYQGQLNFGGSPANGIYDFKMELWTQQTGGTNLPAEFYEDILVVSGLFSIDLDFGDTPFVGDAKFLKIQIRDGNSTGAYQQLSPRQRIDAVPYAIQSEFVKNGSSPWEIVSGGIKYIDDITIGTLTSSSPSKVTIAADSLTEPLRARIGGATRFLVTANGGVAIGNNHASPDAGLYVEGDTNVQGGLKIGNNSILAPLEGIYVEGEAKQAFTAHGFVKAGTIIQCGSGIIGGSQRVFNNLNNDDFSTSSPGPGFTGICEIDTPFNIDSNFYVVSAAAIGGVGSGVLTVNCAVSAPSKLYCQIINSFGSPQNGELQIIVY